MLSKEYGQGMYAAARVAIPMYMLAVPPELFRSEPDHPHPVRQWDFLVAQDFFDHAGNFANGTFAAIAVIGAGAVVDKYVDPRKRDLSMVGVGAAAAATSGGIVWAYESGVSMSGFRKPVGYDGLDVLYGGAAGVLVSLAFCASACRRMMRSRKG